MTRRARARPRPRRTQQERRQATVRALTEAAIASLLELGYARTTVKEICSRAGLSHGALFRFFPTVLDLVIAAGEEVARRQVAAFETRFAPEPGEDPFAAALALLRDACRSPENTVFYELLVAARSDDLLRRALRPAMRAYYDAIRTTARHVPGAGAIPADLLEVLLFSAIHLFDGESISRVVVKRPELEAKRMELLVAAFRAARRLTRSPARRSP